MISCHTHQFPITLHSIDISAKRDGGEREREGGKEREGEREREGGIEGVESCVSGSIVRIQDWSNKEKKEKVRMSRKRTTPLVLGIVRSKFNLHLGQWSR